LFSSNLVPEARMTFHITILGTSSATFGHGRFLTAQVANIHDRLYLVDCGEGTQLQLLKYGINANRIDRIFISHLHGDHYYGLMGLLTSMSLKGRQAPLHLHAHAPLLDVLVAHQRAAQAALQYPLHFHPLEPGQAGVIAAVPGLEVEAFPLRHGIPCSGFLFRETPKPRRIIGERLPQGMPSELIETLKLGQSVRFGGKLCAWEDMTLPPKPSRSYAFCSDTVYHPPLAEWVRGADLLYHEATYDSRLADKALAHGHSTAEQAAQLAMAAGARHLAIGHYSVRYADPALLLEEACGVFPPTWLAEEGKRFHLDIDPDMGIGLSCERLPAKLP
jgi:ribonuclease Z